MSLKPNFAMRVLMVAVLVDAILGCTRRREDDRGFIPTVASLSITANVVPADAPIDVTFDRWLDPNSVSTGTVFIRDVKDVNGPKILAKVSYDPVYRRIRIGTVDDAKPIWLFTGQTYELVFAPEVRAIDGAELGTEVTFRFTALDPSPATLIVEPPVSFCRDVQPVLQQRCSASSCHGSPSTTGAASDRFGPAGSRTSPAQGLVLDTSAGVRSTAVGQVAHASSRDAVAGPLREGTFGVNMPLVDPGNPGRSFLLYKLLLVPPSPATRAPVGRPKCGGGMTAPIENVGITAAPLVDTSEEERARLADRIRGREMPYLSYGVPFGQPLDNDPLTVAELQRIRAWIAQGAVVEECGACEP